MTMNKIQKTKEKKKKERESKLSNFKREETNKIITLYIEVYYIKNVSSDYNNV